MYEERLREKLKICSIDPAQFSFRPGGDVRATIATAAIGAERLARLVMQPVTNCLALFAAECAVPRRDKDARNPLNHESRGDKRIAGIPRPITRSLNR